MSLRQNLQQPGSRLQDLNDPQGAFKNPLQLTFMRILVDVLKDLFQSAVKSNTATPHILLQSPDGTVYKLSVDDAGAVVTENARGT